jgi:hypothetical protein
MRRSTVVIGALVTAAAPFAGGVAYQAWAPPPPAPLAAAAEQSVPEQPAASVRLRPCGARAQLQHGVCVRHRVRTVVVPVAPAPVVTAPSTPAPVAPANGWHSGHHAGHGAAPAAPPEPADEPASAEDVQTCEDHEPYEEDDRSALGATPRGEEACDHEEGPGEHEDDDGGTDLAGDTGQ